MGGILYFGMEDYLFFRGEQLLSFSLDKFHCPSFFHRGSRIRGWRFRVVEGRVLRGGKTAIVGGKRICPPFLFITWISLVFLRGRETTLLSLLFFISNSAFPALCSRQDDGKIVAEME